MRLALGALAVSAILLAGCIRSDEPLETGLREFSTAQLQQEFGSFDAVRSFRDGQYWLYRVDLSDKNRGRLTIYRDGPEDRRSFYGVFDLGVRSGAQYFLIRGARLDRDCQRIAGCDYALVARRGDTLYAWSRTMDEVIDNLGAILRGEGSTSNAGPQARAVLKSAMQTPLENADYWDAHALIPRSRGQKLVDHYEGQEWRKDCHLYSGLGWFFRPKVCGEVSF